MKCPRCGAEMTVDSHRKIPLNMCYECGYIEGRTYDESFDAELETNFKHMKKLNFNEQVAFLIKGLGIDEEKLREFLDKPFEE